jgi:predicted component of type VI protein secretion system
MEEQDKKAKSQESSTPHMARIVERNIQALLARRQTEEKEHPLQDRFVEPEKVLEKMEEQEREFQTKEP